MIRLHAQSPYVAELTEIIFEGEDEELTYSILAAALRRQGWTLWCSRNDEEFHEVGEDEEPEEEE